MENTRNQIKRNLTEIKNFTYISERKLNKIFEKSSPEHIKEFLSDYNCENSQSFTEFIEINDNQFLINWMFKEGIN